MAIGKTLDLELLLRPEPLARQIADKYQSWKNARTRKEAEWSELRNYVFAIDTATTTNAKLPWKNRTHRPKLCQIRDNLYANYMAALFPRDDWFKWEAADEQSAGADKRKAIEAYMQHILKSSGFERTVGQLVYDYIDYGNVFAEPFLVNEKTQVPGPMGTNAAITTYSGPKLVRISPLDITFDITAASFDESPKITRTLLSLGQLHKLVASAPEWRVIGEETLSRIKENRHSVISGGRTTLSKADAQKAAGLTADGFSSIYDYYASGMVEILVFEGDLYDATANKLYENHRITILDRAYVIQQEPIANWFGVSAKKHCGWRSRPDNLMAMGPLDNLVGLQYRLDHLENLKADVFDLIAVPVFKVKGYVEDFVYGPGEKIFMEQDADVEFMRPDSIALNAELQIAQIEQTMEEMAGAPRQAMGIRTPGEKTAFEVQALDNGSSRMFQNKIAYFEKWFIEPLLNHMLEMARRNLDVPTTIAVLGNDLGIIEFLDITREDITAKGRLVPMGARHFAAQNQLVQNLTALSGTGVYQDPGVQAHLSGKAIAKVIVDALSLSKYNIYSENIRVIEQQETTQLAQQAQEELQVAAMTPLDQPTDQGAEPEQEGEPTV